MLIADFPLAALSDVFQLLVYVLFVSSGLVLTIVVLLQEGKGGGLGSAFGGAAADAFGVKAGTVNRFTAYLAASFLGLALLYLGLSSEGTKIKLGAPGPQIQGGPDSPGAPAVGGGEGAPEIPAEIPAETPGEGPPPEAPGAGEDVPPDEGPGEPDEGGEDE